MKSKTACFTGHRPKGLPWGFNEDDERCHKLKAALKQAVVEACHEGFLHFIAGGALGVDTYAAEAVIELKKEIPLTLEIAVPCRGQGDKWPADMRRRYRSILENSDKVTVLSLFYTPWCMQYRNRYMIDHSSRLIAVFLGGYGGTAKTICYAREKGLDIRFIDIAT